MIRQVIIILTLTLILTACGGAAPTQTSPAPTQETTIAPTSQPEATSTSEPTQTFTPALTDTPTITPTPTLLPPLFLPTELANAPALLPWDGVPTYLGDSKPGYDFRVSYDPEVWALTEDQFGFPALGHRDIQYCVISVTSGRGLPPNITTEQDILYTDTVTFNVSTAYENGVKKFVTYTGGDGTIVTGFEVSFEEQADQCIADAETVLTTLRSVPATRATPTPTP